MRILRKINRAAAGLVALALCLFVNNAQAAYNIVAADSNGDVTFTPSVLGVPILTAVVAAVGSGAALVVIAIGVAWVYRMFKKR